MLLPQLFLAVYLFQVHRVQAGGEEPRQARRVIRARRRLLPQRQNMRHPLTHQGVPIQGAAGQADLQLLLHEIVRRAFFLHMLSRHALFQRCFSQPVFFQPSFLQFSLFSSFSELLLTHDVFLLSSVIRSINRQAISAAPAASKRAPHPGAPGLGKRHPPNRRGSRRYAAPGRNRAPSACRDPRRRSARR